MSEKESECPYTISCAVLQQVKYVDDDGLFLNELNARNCTCGAGVRNN